MTPLVISTVQLHANLNNSELLQNYSGPLRLVRRTEDEIIADPPCQLNANRGNFLLLETVARRYEEISGSRPSSRSMSALHEWVDKPHDREVGQWDSLGLVSSPVDLEEVHAVIAMVSYLCNCMSLCVLSRWKQ